MRRFIIIFTITFLSVSVSSFASERMEKARALYAQGPSKSQEAIFLLEEEIQTNPNNEKAIMLLGVTYYGTGDFEKALEQFEKIPDVTPESKQINPTFLLYKAKTLHMLCRNEEALKILDVFNAFWLGTQREEEYISLHTEVVNNLNQGVCPDLDPPLNFEELKEKAQKGDKESQAKLGTIYAQGKDFEEAKKWWELAAAQDHAGAQFNLGLMHVQGVGVEKDSAKAFQWFKLSAEQGNPDAQNSLGVMYFHGDGVSQSFAESKKWYQKAAAQGHVGAKRSLERNKNEGKF